MSLLGLLVITFLFFTDASNFFPFSDLVSANGNQVFEKKEYWRLFTTTLVHADLNHLALNSIAFTILALLLNTYFGALVFPALSFLIGGVINVIALKFYPGYVTLVGISGVIYFMAAFWMTLYVSIEKRISIGRRLINTTAMCLIFLFPQGGILEERVSYSSHAIGFGLGLSLGAIYYLFNKERFDAKEVWVEIWPDPQDELLDFLSLNHDQLVKEQEEEVQH